MIRPAFSYPLEIASMASSSDCQNLRTSGGFAREEGWLVIGVTYSWGYNQAVSSAKSFWRRLGKIVVIMELPVQPSSQPSRGRNFERAPWCYLLWGIPAVLVIGAGIAYGESVLSHYWPRNHLCGSGRLGWTRLLSERSILRQGPL